jgi:hypothetical protein
MGLLAETVKRCNGVLIGVITRHLIDKEMLFHALDECIVVDSMHERKRVIHEKSSRFLVMPGGIGNCERVVLAQIFPYSPQPSPAKDIIILSKLLARERGQIEVKFKTCAQNQFKRCSKKLQGRCLFMVKNFQHVIWLKSMCSNTLKFIRIENVFIRCLVINHLYPLKTKKWLSKVSDFPGQDQTC